MSNSIGIYIHIPFCRSKCPYCDFFSMRGNSDDYNKYVNVLKAKIKNWGKKIDKHVDTIYFGGGTPSVIGADLICEILESIKNNFYVCEDAEITMEANPASGKFFDFEKAKKHGINRVSLGIQSANSEELKMLGRLHSLEDVKSTIELIKNSGIKNISLDVMLGISMQTKESLKETLDFCIKSDIKHISSYILKIEENTLYYKKKDRYHFPDDDLTSELYLYAVEYLNKNGFNQYEISNFSRQGFESKHNLKYWNLKDYLGIGPAAHSFINGKRFYYERNFEDFANDVIKDEGIGGSEEEYIMLKLRLKSGLDVKEFEEVFGHELSENFFKKVNLYKKTGFIDVSDNIISFTPKGFLVSNAILADLI
ncbi:MAG: radical SAM family heme chaperone HemW [Ruminococcus sp.]|nr:radical SAM family heme chaperone HemW [Ruminococcus sp.]